MSPEQMKGQVGSRRWQAATASVRGAQHDRTGLPNQDAVRVLDVDGAVAGLVAAVADGHGGSRYVRSELGSRFAVEIACDVGAQLLASLGGAPDARTLRRAIESNVAPVIVDRWREAVLDDHGSRPFSTEERARGGALDADAPVAYGCTLIVAVLSPNWGAIVQIGDGDALVVDADGRTHVPVPSDARLVGGETTSLCLPDAAADARVAVLDVPLPDLVVLTSDGYGNSFASGEWRSEAGIGLLEAVRRDGLPSVAERLPAWLADSAVAGGDDVTMALIVNGPAPAPTTAGAAPRIATEPTVEQALLRAPRRRALTRRRAVGAAAVVSIAGVGGVLGWFARGPTETTSTAASPSGTPSTTAAGATPTAEVPPESGITSPPRYAAVTKSGVVVTFESDQTPDPQPLAASSGLSRHSPPTDASGRRWTASSKSVRATRPQSATLEIPLPSAVGDGDLVLVGSTLWVLSSDGSTLWSIDTSEPEPTVRPPTGWPVPATPR